MPRSDERLDRAIGALLRSGVSLSAAVVLVGLLLHLAAHAHSPADYRVFRGEPPHLWTLSGIVRGVAAGNALSLMQLGLVLLIATPVLRVALCLVVFAAQRDRTYVAITLVVLTILLYSLFGAG